MSFLLICAGITRGEITKMTSQERLPQIHDYRRMRWGWTCEIQKLEDDGRKARGSGYGGGIRVGDVVLVPSFDGKFEPHKVDAQLDGEDIVLYWYRVTEIKYTRRDWYVAQFEYDDTLFKGNEDGEIVRVETGTTKGEEPLTDSEQIALDLINASGGVSAAPGTSYYRDFETLARRGLVRFDGKDYCRVDQP